MDIPPAPLSIEVSITVEQIFEIVEMDYTFEVPLEGSKSVSEESRQSLRNGLAGAGKVQADAFVARRGDLPAVQRRRSMGNAGPVPGGMATGRRLLVSTATVCHHAVV